MKKVLFPLLLMAAVAFIFMASFNWEEDTTDIPTATVAQKPPTAAPTVPPAATAAKAASPAPNRTPSSRPSLAVTGAPSQAATSVRSTAGSLSRFRVGYTTAFILSVDPALWEASAVPTPTGLAYSLTYKKLPGCQFLDEAGRDAPAGWSHTSAPRSLGGRTYTLENWFDPSNGKLALAIYALDPRIRIQLNVPSGSSECVQAAETVISASTLTLLGP